MTKDEMLRILKKVEFCAIPTVITMDMGLQYDYVTPEGAGTGFGGMGRWPVYQLSGIEKSRWKEIRTKLSNKTLETLDLQGTDLDNFVESMFNEYYGTQFREIELNEMLVGLLSLPDESPTFFYAIFDMGDIGHEGHIPEFYDSKEKMLSEFQAYYCSDVDAWESMDEETLRSWIDRLDSNFDEFPMYQLEQ